MSEDWYEEEDIVTTSPPKESPREELLDEAKKLITQDRNNSYGPPTQDFDKTAKAASAYGWRLVTPDGSVRNVQSHDVALFVMLIKLSRLTWSPEKRDHWADIAGYAGCGWECSDEERRVE